MDLRYRGRWCCRVWTGNGGGCGFGPTGELEFTPIKNWLVIETGPG